MLRYFKNILIPVDLSINTEVAIKKAIDLADAGPLAVGVVRTANEQVKAAADACSWGLRQPMVD